MDRLCDDVMLEILSYLSIQDILQLCQTNSVFLTLCNGSQRLLEEKYLEYLDRKVFRDHQVDKNQMRIHQNAILVNVQLITASLNGRLENVEYLLTFRGADPSYDRNCAIQMACKDGHLAVVDRLLRDDRVDPSYSLNRSSCEQCMVVI